MKGKARDGGGGGPSVRRRTDDRRGRSYRLARDGHYQVVIFNHLMRYTHTLVRISERSTRG